MSLEQDLAEARKKVQSWQSQTYVGIVGVAICVVMFFSISMIMLDAPMSQNIDGERDMCLLSIFIGFVFLGYSTVADGMKVEAERLVDSINHDISQRKSAKNRERAQANQRKRNLEHKDRELKEAKRLMEKGGIGNLNKAIGIFKKYGK